MLNEKKTTTTISNVLGLCKKIVFPVWHEFSITKETRPHVEAARRPAPPVVELPGKLQWAWKHHDKPTQDKTNQGKNPL